MLCCYGTRGQAPLQRSPFPRPTGGRTCTAWRGAHTSRSCLSPVRSFCLNRPCYLEILPQASAMPPPCLFAPQLALHLALRAPTPTARDEPLLLQGGCYRRGAAPPAACLMLAGPRCSRRGRMPPEEALLSIVTLRPGAACTSAHISSWTRDDFTHLPARLPACLPEPRRNPIRMFLRRPNPCRRCGRHPASVGPPQGLQPCLLLPPPLASCDGCGVVPAAGGCVLQRGRRQVRSGLRWGEG